MKNKIFKKFLENIELGEAQYFRNVVIIPVFVNLKSNVKYITLSEAIEKKFLIIKEVDEYGSVPELKIINKSEFPVLIIDGEELKGVKQNRMVNTTILIKEKSETIIPVSCVEEGRWHYDNESHAKSENIAFFCLRKEKADTVKESLKREESFSADQEVVWDRIKDKMYEEKTTSQTFAMSDIYDSKKEEVENYLEYFKLQPEQKGLIVFINGKIAGFDVVSLESAYKNLHEKLVKSYVLDALSNTRDYPENVGNLKENIKEFFKKILLSTEKNYNSIGYGKDYRYESPEIIGSALVYKDTVIHASFFHDIKENDFIFENEDNYFADFKTRFSKRKNR